MQVNQCKNSFVVVIYEPVLVEWLLRFWHKQISEGILVYFTNIVGIILSFPKLIAGLFLVLTMTFLLIIKKQALPFQITKVRCENSLKEIVSDQRPSEQII